MIDLNDDLSDLLGLPAGTAKPLPQDETFTRIRNTVPEFTETCPRCSGSGRFGRYGQCYACKGRGTQTFKQPAHVRQQNRDAARQRKLDRQQEAQAAFARQYPVEAAWIQASKETFGFALAMEVAIDKYGSLTPSQLSAVQRCVQRSEQRESDKAARQQAQLPRAEALDLAKVLQAIQAGKASGLKWVRLRFDGVTIEEAAKHPGVLYIKRGDQDRTYLGKVVDGRFLPSRDCNQDDQQKIRLIAADPFAAAKVYGNITNNCCVCGKELSNKESVELGIGPICGKRLNWVSGGIRVQAQPTF